MAMGVLLALLLLLAGADSAPAPSPLPVRRLGLYLPGFYETTPVVWHGDLLLVECIHEGLPLLVSPAAKRNLPPKQNHTYYRIRQPGYDGRVVVPIVPGSVGFHFVAAVVAADPMAEGGEALWITGTVDPPLAAVVPRNQIYSWVSRDAGLQRWNRSLALQLPPGYSAWNTDVTAGPNGTWVMAIELQAPAKVVGVPFSTAFAVCRHCGTDLSTGWCPCPPAHSAPPSRDRPSSLDDTS